MKHANRLAYKRRKVEAEGVMGARNFHQPVYLLLITVVFIALTAPPATAQPEDTTAIEKLLTAVRSKDCEDYILNARKLIPRYHSQGKFDSITSVIDYIAVRCPCDYFRPYRLLRQIQTGKLASDWCDTIFVQEMFLESEYYCFDLAFLCGSAVTSDSDYASFINRFASEMKYDEDAPSVARAIATYYADGRGTLLEKLAAYSYPGSCLQVFYDAKIDSLVQRRRDFATDLSASAGLWIPTGNLATLGPKPEIGAQAGLRNRRFGADLTFLFRFTGASHLYVVRYRDSLHATDNFQSFYAGVNPVLRVYSSWTKSFEIFGGIGWDGIMVLTANDIHEGSEHYLNSFSVNAGMTMRWFYNVRRTRFFGVQARYNFVDFDTDGGTDLSGNSISINLIWGWMGHGWTDNLLESMYYRPRQR